MHDPAGFGWLDPTTRHKAEEGSITFNAAVTL
jgi:hypothetical protein